MKKFPSLALPVLIALSVPLTRGASQIARGTVTERGSGAAIPGVLVSLVDEAGRAVSTVFTDERGNYDMSAPSAGRYAIEAKRIGVRQKRGALFALAAGETHRENVVLDPVVSLLSGMKVEGRSKCVARPGDDARTATLWENARAALTATVLTSRKPIFGMITRFTRDRDLDDGRILNSDHQSARGSITRPFVSIPVEQLSREGYVVPRDDGSTDYRAPDAEALLSDEFLRDHCFRVVPGGPERVRMVGLGFEPVKGRKVADVEGVLWMDAATAELESIEFTYPSIPKLRTDRKFGGLVRFSRIPNGRWIVSAWVIRMPIMVEDRRERSTLPGNLEVEASSRLLLKAVREEGGTVLVERGAPPPRRAITGVVIGGTGVPVAGARVSVAGTSISAKTGSDGHFEITGIPEGLYSVLVTTAELDSLGVTGPADTVRLTARGGPDVTLTVPSRASLASVMCPDSPVDQRLAALRVLVVDSASGAPLSGAGARVWWQSFSGSVARRTLAERKDGMEAKLDSLGSFTICGLPAEQPIFVESPRGAKVTFSDTLSAAAGEVGWRVVRAKKNP
ncbi:MAG TPA: carboxypeptidase-like regulatory domain-containing protein [Gemmatimonadaceae bacterium]|nr:carboxypeptidase-like regulatory domain-containing protein [Gemmatimonadaceae bacterium]